MGSALLLRWRRFLGLVLPVSLLTENCGYVDFVERWSRSVVN